MQHETVVARALAKGVVRDGLRGQRVDLGWTAQGTFDLNGSGLVGYVAKLGSLPLIVRASALKHLLAIVGAAAIPDTAKLCEKYMTQQDFMAWLRLPAFWFDAEERAHFEALLTSV